MDNSHDGLLRVIEDLREENRRLKEKLEELNPIDQLTGLYNRKALYNRLEYEVLRAERNQPFLSLLMLKISDYDDMLQKNGRDMMEVVERLMANSLKASVRAVDILGRYGNGSFLILLPDIHANKGPVVVERLKKLIEKELQTTGVKVKFSSGAKLYEGQPVHELLEEVEHLTTLSEREGMGRTHR